MRNHLSTALLLYIASLLLFGSNGIFAAAISLPSQGVVFLRTLLGAAALLAAGIFTLPRGTLRETLSHRKAVLCVTLSGLAQGAAWICLFEAYRRVGVGVASMLYYTGPVIVLALSLLVFRERISHSAVAGMGAVLLGVAALNPGVAPGAGASVLAGFALGLASAVFYACVVIANRQGAAVTGIPNAVIQLAAAFALAALYYWGSTGSAFPVPAATDWWAVLMLGCVNTGLGCLVYFSVISRLPVTQVAVFGYLEPLSALLFSCLFLGERLTPMQLAGTLLILAGIAYAEKRPALPAPRRAS